MTDNYLKRKFKILRSSCIIWPDALLQKEQSKSALFLLQLKLDVPKTLKTSHLVLWPQVNSLADEN